jgi:pseudaminic acid synthase
VGAGHPVYIVAEISANHGGDLDRAVQLVRAAGKAGADAVKFQTYTADTMTLDSGEAPFRIDGGTPWDGRTLHDLYEEGHTPWEWIPRLAAEARQVGLDWFSSAFDATAVEWLESLGVMLHKVASFELIDFALIERMARTGKPLIMSTGMATFTEITDAVAAARRGGAQEIALLRCCSAYPAPHEEMHLRTIPHLAAALDVPVGLSDHTLGWTVAVAAVALGAVIVEKHLTLSRAERGPDNAFSLEPAEFGALVAAVRSAEAALGQVRYGAAEAEAASLRFRRSLFVVRAVRAGQVFVDDMVRTVRPGHGLAPRHLQDVIGRKAAVDIDPGTPLTWQMVGGPVEPSE